MCPYNKTWFSRNTDLFWQCFKNRCRVRYSRIPINNGKFHCVSASGKLYVLQCLSFYNVLASVTLLNHGDEGAVEPQAGSVKHNEKTLTNSTPPPSPKWWRNPWAAWVHWGLACRRGWRGTPSCRPCWSRSPCWSWRGTHPGDLKNKPTVENLAFFWFSYRKKEKECNFL